MKYFLMDLDPKKTTVVTYYGYFDNRVPSSPSKLSRKAFPTVEPIFPPLIIEELENLKNWIGTEVVPEVFEDDFTMHSGYILSEKLLEVILKYNIANYRVYPLSIVNLPQNYFYLHLISMDIINKIDFHKSAFYLSHFPTQRLSIENTSGFLKHPVKKFFEKNKLVADPLCINDDLPDLYRIDRFFFFPIVSERLKVEIELLSNAFIFDEINISMNK